VKKTSTALERFARWLDAEDSDDAVGRYRRFFAALWAVYDALDLSCGFTERSRNWFPHERSLDLALLQGSLVVIGIMLFRGKRVWPFGMLACAARTVEALGFFRLNDFCFGSIVYALLAHSDGGPFASGRRPKWVREALRLQIAWVYLATAFLKLSPAWLGGGHLFVRTQYLARAMAWPYPAPLARALAHLAFDAVLAQMGAVLEFALGAVLIAGGPYWLGVGLGIAIHSFGALLANIWFFSATMVATVVLVLPRREAGSRRRAGEIAPRN
jgi:Vitamin K-dependent gamma-carboxylase